jgi:hypothetical protein
MVLRKHLRFPPAPFLRCADHYTAPPPPCSHLIMCMDTHVHPVVHRPCRHTLLGWRRGVVGWIFTSTPATMVAAALHPHHHHVSGPLPVTWCARVCTTTYGCANSSGGSRGGGHRVGLGSGACIPVQVVLFTSAPCTVPVMGEGNPIPWTEFTCVCAHLGVGMCQCGHVLPPLSHPVVLRPAVPVLWQSWSKRRCQHGSATEPPSLPSLHWSRGCRWWWGLAGP